MALQPGVGLGLLYNTPPSLSIPCSVSPYPYNSNFCTCYRVRAQVYSPAWHSWGPNAIPDLSIELLVDKLELEQGFLRVLRFFLVSITSSMLRSSLNTFDSAVKSNASKLMYTRGHWRYTDRLRSTVYSHALYTGLFDVNSKTNVLYTGLFKMIVGVIHNTLQMQPHAISFYGVTSRIRFIFLLFPQVSRNWRYESEPSLKPSPLTCGTNSTIVLLFVESQRVHI